MLKWERAQINFQKSTKLTINSSNLKNIKKIIQNTFKFIFYKIFVLFHGKIKGKMNSDNDSRIKVETVKKDNNLQYKIFKIINGRLYTDRIHDAAIIVDNFVVEGPLSNSDVRITLKEMKIMLKLKKI